VPIASEQVFSEQINAWVKGALLAGVGTLDEFLAALPGVYPSVALEAAHRLTSHHQELSGTLTRILQQPKVPRKAKGSRHEIELPMPHPLDYDWRFSDTTVNRLLENCEQLTDPGGKIVLLGAPSVLRSATEAALDREVMLLDACGTTVAAFASLAGKALKCDLMVDPIPKLAADAVIGDPPWYREEMCAFLWAATSLVRVGGYIVMSVPSIGTRSTIESERSEFFAFGNELGLALVKIQSLALIYESPLFEMNALKVEGIPEISGNWRRGDLALFQKVDDCSKVSRPAYQSSVGSWDEEQVGGVRWRIKRNCNYEIKDPTLISIVPGNVLPSVSRRDARRMHAEVWTSGNRVFGTAGSHSLRRILRALQRELDVECYVESDIGRTLSAGELRLLRNASSQVKEIIELERDENLRFRGQ
jgi:hypothetical protein